MIRTYLDCMSDTFRAWRKGIVIIVICSATTATIFYHALTASKMQFKHVHNAVTFDLSCAIVMHMYVGFMWSLWTYRLASVAHK